MSSFFYLKCTELYTCLCNVANVVYPRVMFKSIAEPLYKKLPSTSNHSSPNDSLNCKLVRLGNLLQLGSIERAVNLLFTLILYLILYWYSVQDLANCEDLFCSIW